MQLRTSRADPSRDFAIDGLVDGDVCDLNVLTPVSGWTLRQAWGINEFSQIVGSAQNNTTGENRGFVINAAWTEGLVMLTHQDLPYASWSSVA